MSTAREDGGYLAAAVAAASAASEVLMARFRAGVQDLAGWEKSPGALVTEADIESDETIAASLAASGVGGVIISEESHVDLGTGDGDGASVGARVEWLIDPLCGTVPFSHGMNHWGVNIAMRRDGELAVAALAVPTCDVLLTADAADGVRLNGEPLAVSPPTRGLGEAIVGLEIDGQDVWQSLLASGGLDWVTRVGQVNSYASAAYPMMLLATGRMSAVVFYRIEPMHLAAGALAARLLGARATDEGGRDIDWSRDDELGVAVLGWEGVHDGVLGGMG